MTTQEKLVANIKKIHYLLTGKTDSDFVATYRGTSHGIKKPWNVKMFIHEVDALTFDEAISELYLKLTAELKAKADTTAKEAEALRKQINELEN